MNQPHILVVDDDIALCELVRAALELEGIAVDEAHHVVEADRLLHERIPDAVVLDIGLPGIDGLFFCGRLRENPQTAGIPIIAISGSDAERRIGPGGGSDRVRPEAVRPARAADAARAGDRRHAAHARLRPGRFRRGREGERRRASGGWSSSAAGGTSRSTAPTGRRSQRSPDRSRFAGSTRARTRGASPPMRCG